MLSHIRKGREAAGGTLIRIYTISTAVIKTDDSTNPIRNPASRMSRKLPIGISDFKKVIEGFHYVDKSLFIQEILEESAKALSITRPRRFGKTLNLSMLKYFFEKSEENLRPLFEELAIADIPPCMEHQGQYPVIFLTFKRIDKSTFEECVREFRAILGAEFKRHAPLLEQSVDKYDRPKLERYLQDDVDAVDLERSLLNLTEWLHKASGKKAILLIDEYDTPMRTAYTRGYYKECASFMDNLLVAGLKDNVHLKKGVLTGIFHVPCDSIFSGLNNLVVRTILRQSFSDKFGFTESEVEHLFKDSSLPLERIKEAKDWYNGYRFGDKTIYNPWSLLNYLDNPNEGLIPHWINTSSNDLIHEKIIQGNPALHQNLETLLSGGTISNRLDEHISLRDIQTSQDVIYSLLVHSGYLKASNKRREDLYDIYELTIPNEEVRFFYKRTISSWMEQSLENEKINEMLKALLAGQIETFGDYLQEFVTNALSFAGENPERVYHAFVLGLLVNLGGRYRVDSNRESGYGRYDVMLIPENKNDPGIVLEFKVFNPQREKNEQVALESALQQIKDKDYAARLRDLGIKDILGVGIVFEGKRVHLDSLIFSDG